MHHTLRCGGVEGGRGEVAGAARRRVDAVTAATMVRGTEAG